MFANNGWLKRIGHLLVATVAMIVSAGWFVVVTMLVPASSRPYIGGSTNNTFMDLVWGYNGVGRISGGGNGGGPGGGGQAGSSFGGSTGLNRLFSSEMGNEISWLLPVALLALAFAIYAMVRSFPGFRFTGRVSRVESGAVVAWGGWLLVTGLIFSFMSGTIHPYYTVALAPAIGALVGIGAVMAWRRRDHWDGRIAMSAMIGLAAGWSIVLLNRNDFGPVWCRWLIGTAAVLAVLGVLVASRLGLRKLLATSLIVGSLAGAGGSVGFAIATAATSHSGSIPTAVSTSMDGGGMGGMGGGPGGGGNRGGGTPPGQTQDGQTQNGQTQDGQTQQGQTQRSQRGGMQGGPGGGSSSNTELTALLKSTDTTWAAAVSGSQSAATLELATGKAVMGMGGWMNDPAPTLDEFIAYVKAGKIAYYIGGSQGGGPGGNSSSEIATWVAQNYTATTVGGTTVYKLI